MIAKPHCQRDSEWIDLKSKRHYVAWKRVFAIYKSVHVEFIIFIQVILLSVYVF